jgi:hypothetical protein
MLARSVNNHACKGCYAMRPCGVRHVGWQPGCGALLQRGLLSLWSFIRCEATVHTTAVVHTITAVVRRPDGACVIPLTD